MILKVDRFVTALNNYNARKEELLKQPSTVEILEDEALKFYAEVIAKRLQDITFIEPVKKVDAVKKKKKKEK